MQTLMTPVMRSPQEKPISPRTGNGTPKGIVLHRCLPKGNQPGPQPQTVRERYGGLVARSCGNQAAQPKCKGRHKAVPSKPGGGFFY